MGEDRIRYLQRKSFDFIRNKADLSKRKQYDPQKHQEKFQYFENEETFLKQFIESEFVDYPFYPRFIICIDIPKS